MKVTVAESAGFCFGVRRAVDMAFELAGSPGRVRTFGELIHNPYIVSELAERGVCAISSPEQAQAGDTVLIRSHGVGAGVIAQLTGRGCGVVDATCPFVARIHRIAASAGEKQLVLIAGDEKHPEVQGIIGHCSAPYFCFSSCEDLDKNVSKMGDLSIVSCILVSQTTFFLEEWEKCKEKLKKVCTNLEIFDTICSATEKRQREAKSLAACSDAMVVVGGRNSSNTKKLASVCAEHCKTFLVENAQELYKKCWDGYTTIGITAGASTPACIIKEVHKTMSEIEKDQEELSFEEMLNQSFKTIDNKEKVTATVIGVKPTEIEVDIGTKHACYVPLTELTDDPAAKTEDLVKVGDTLELIVVRVNDVEGTVMLSKKRLDAIAGFEKVMNAADTEEVLEGTVVEIIKGGILVLSNGVRVFVPASQATLSRGDDLETLKGQKVNFKILEVNRQRKRAVGSIRAVLREQRKELEDKFWEGVEVGKHFTGVVKSLTSYGAFVNLGGVDGMIHISELSWSRIKHPSEVVKVGDTVEVYIRDVDSEHKKISLGYKKSEDNPWAIMAEKYNVGDVCAVKIVSLTPFGAFAQIIPGVDGLIHISQISNERIEKPADVLSVGQEVDVKITELDLEKKRVSLSMRALIEAAAGQQQAQQEPQDSVVYEAGPDTAAAEAEPQAAEQQ